METNDNFRFAERLLDSAYKDGGKDFAKFLIDKSMHGVIPIDAIPTLVKEWAGDKG
ncbi:MAG: hypothetical protein IJO73_02430 [Clostridia bacterium]|nr:hypothetical protein [Clostridia bacterium]